MFLVVCLLFHYVVFCSKSIFLERLILSPVTRPPPKRSQGGLMRDPLPGSSEHSRRSDCSAKRMTCNIAWRLAFEGLNEADVDAGMIPESVDTRVQKICYFYMMLVCLMCTHVRAELNWYGRYTVHLRKYMLHNIDRFTNDPGS